MNDTKVPCYSVFSFLFLFLNTWMRTNSVRVMITFSKLPFQKLLDISYVQSSFSTIARYIDNGIWKTPYSLRFYRLGSPYLLIISCVNIMKPKSVKVLGKLTVAQKPCSSKNIVSTRFTYYCILLFLSNKPSV